MMKGSKLLAVSLFGAMMFGSTVASATDYPVRPVTLVVPFIAGGAFDVVARLAAERLGDELGKSFVVENKPGAGGTLGGRIVANAKPDGHTILLSGVGPISIAPAVYKNLGYSPAKGLAPVIQLTSSPFVLVTSGQYKGASVKDFVGYLQAAPGEYNYASTGNGTLVHLAGEYFKGQTKTEFEHIPYGGGSQATLSLLSGDSLFSITNIPNVLGQVTTGKLKAVATTGSARSAVFPDLPTMIESGLPNFDLTGWIGIFAPAGTPDDVIEKLNGAFAKVMQQPDMKKRLIEQGDEVATGSVKDFQQFVAHSDQTWQAIASDANVSID